MSIYGAGVHARRVARFADDLRAGERLIVNYCADVAGCSCPSTHDFGGVACKPVARTGEGKRLGPHATQMSGVDRCLQCGARWQRRDYRTDPLVLVHDAVT